MSGIFLFVLFIISSATAHLRYEAVFSAVTVLMVIICDESCIFLYLYLSGMFANAEGISQRAPVSWSESVIAAAVCFPYVVALDESFVTVHSMLDQQLKQTLSFRDGHLLQDFEGKSVSPYILHYFTLRADSHIPHFCW